MRVRLFAVVTSALLMLGLLVGTSAAAEATGWDTFNSEKAVETTGDTKTVIGETPVTPTAIRVVVKRRTNDETKPRPRIRLNWTLTCTDAGSNLTADAEPNVMTDSGRFVLKAGKLRKAKNLGASWVEDFDNCNLTVTSNNGKVKYKLQAQYALAPTIDSSSQWVVRMTPLFESGVSCSSEPRPSHCDGDLTGPYDLNFTIVDGVVSGSQNVNQLEKTVTMFGFIKGNGSAVLFAELSNNSGVQSTITFEGMLMGNCLIAGTDPTGSYTHQYTTTSYDISGDFTLTRVGSDCVSS